MSYFRSLMVAGAVLVSISTDARAGSFLTGRQLAQRDCGACHAVGVKGPSPDPAAPPFRSLGNRYDVRDLQEALAEGISVGHPKMPVFSYPPDQVHRLIDYLQQLQPTRPHANTRRRPE